MHNHIDSFVHMPVIMTHQTRLRICAHLVSCKRCDQCQQYRRQPLKLLCTEVKNKICKSQPGYGLKDDVSYIFLYLHSKNENWSMKLRSTCKNNTHRCSSSELVNAKNINKFH